jgi:hypothetical protein
MFSRLELAFVFIPTPPLAVSLFPLFPLLLLVIPFIPMDTNPPFKDLPLPSSKGIFNNAPLILI